MPGSMHTRRHSFTPTIIQGENVRESASSSSFLPPAYHSSGRGNHNGRRHSTQQSLPAYAQATALDFRQHREAASRDPHHGGQSQEHEYHLTSTGDNTGRQWATLKVFSRPFISSSAFQHKCPKYFGGDDVVGLVQLDLDKPQTINSVTISLRGRFITSALEQGNYTFLNQTVTVWDKNIGDPHTAASPFDIASSRKVKFNSKLQGRYAWPFSFPFPTEISLLQKGGNARQMVVQTPQTFLERGVNANIQYHLVMHITHGLFRANSKLSTIINFVPSITPSPPSFLRQQAYQHGGFLFPPSEDPQGWHTFPPQPFSIEIEANSYQVFYSLSFATPLSYTRGTVLPCFLKVIGVNPLPVKLSTLLLESSQPRLSLILCRKVAHLPSSSQAAGRSGNLLTGDPRPANVVTSVEEAGRAVWWVPSSAGANAPRPVVEGNRTCVLEGEIHLSEDLQPSCQAGFLSIEYFVSLMTPFAGSNTGPSIKPLGPLHPSLPVNGMQPISEAHHSVQIVTFHMDGPLPTPFTPRSRHRSKKSTSSSTVSRNRNDPADSDAQFLEVLTANCFA